MIFFAVYHASDWKIHRKSIYIPSSLLTRLLMEDPSLHHPGYRMQAGLGVYPVGYFTCPEER